MPPEGAPHPPPARARRSNGLCIFWDATLPSIMTLFFFYVTNTRGSRTRRGGQTLLAMNFPAAGPLLPLHRPPPPSPCSRWVLPGGFWAGGGSRRTRLPWVGEHSHTNPLGPCETTPNHCIHPPRAPRRKWHHDFHFAPFLTDPRKTTRPKTILGVSDVRGWAGRSGMLSSDLEEKLIFRS